MRARRQFPTTNLNRRRRFDADANLLAADFQDGNRNALPDDQLLSRSPR
jgi:hypothetical protein